MIHDFWEGNWLGFVYVDEGCVWITDSARRHRCYDYCVNYGIVERFVSSMPSHLTMHERFIVMLIVCVYWKGILMKYHEHDVKGLLTN